MRLSKSETGCYNEICLIFVKSNVYIVFLTEISLASFKNIENSKLQFASGINCLTGLNGMGKTNCLDAVFLLCVGKSHFNISDQQLIRQSSGFFRVDGVFEDKEGHKQKVVVKLPDAGKKIISLDGKAYKKIAEHLGRFPVVMIAPDDTEIVSGQAELRRRFVDTALCQTDAEYLVALSAYNKILKQRNACLKLFSTNGKVDLNLLETYDVQLCTQAQIIHSKRKNFVEGLNTLFVLKYQEITSGSETVNVTYQSQLNNASYRDLLIESQRKDLVTERTNSGVHKDDLVISIEDRDARKFASQGQVKSLLFSLKFAEYEIVKDESGMQPILLLDDIFDKLDDIRVRNLLDLLKSSTFGQVFITDTSTERLNSILSGVFSDFRSFAVESGVITPINHEKAQ